MGKELIFYYDIICPYAYLASKLIGDVANRNGAKLIWRPVLLGKFQNVSSLLFMELPCMEHSFNLHTDFVDIL